MKKAISIFLIVLGFSFGYSQSYEILNDGKDTLNYIDVSGKKQGKWVVFGKHKPNDCYKPNQKVEEGVYQENRKQGSWIEYFCNGNKKNELTFLNGRPNGYAIMYYENGNKKEEGEWKVNKWVGNYKLYYENGQVQHDFKFNQSGKREGNQVYIYENGQVAVQGNFNNGKEAGVITEYYENGEVKALKTYNEGNVDVASIKTFEPKKPVQKVVKDEISAPSKAEVIVKKEEVIDNQEQGQKLISGKHILYNKNKQISKDGIFKNNRLIEGKAFIYDENGILTRIAIYKNGVYVGDGTIEN